MSPYSSNSDSGCGASWNENTRCISMYIDVYRCGVVGWQRAFSRTASSRRTRCLNCCDPFPYWIVEDTRHIVVEWAKRVRAQLCGMLNVHIAATNVPVHNVHRGRNNNIEEVRLLRELFFIALSSASNLLLRSPSSLCVAWDRLISPSSSLSNISSFARDTVSQMWYESRSLFMNIWSAAAWRAPCISKRHHVPYRAQFECPAAKKYEGICFTQCKCSSQSDYFSARMNLHIIIAVGTIKQSIHSRPVGNAWALPFLARLASQLRWYLCDGLRLTAKFAPCEVHAMPCRSSYSPHQRMRNPTGLLVPYPIVSVLIQLMNDINTCIPPGRSTISFNLSWSDHLIYNDTLYSCISATIWVMFVPCCRKNYSACTNVVRTVSMCADCE